MYEGPWKTTNRKLDGIQTAEVKWVDKEKWEARFYGTWQRVDYSYNVKFTGPQEALKGTAEIDGAYYEWTGQIGDKKFIGKFTGDRYTGSFEMNRK